MKPVFEARDLREAGMVAAYLLDRGLSAEVRGGAFSAVRPELSNVKGLQPQVCVRVDSEEARARELVAAYLDLLRKEPEGEPWVCPACGETLEPQFQSCWKCQAEKPA